MDERLDLTGIFDRMFADIREATAGIGGAQQQFLGVSATARSEDGMVEVTVGPRGQLVDLKLDPRIYRKPNSTELANKIVETTRRASEDAMNQGKQIVDQNTPAELDVSKFGDATVSGMMHRHDADIVKEREAEKEEDENDG